MNTTAYPPFSIRDASWALYLSDGSGNVGNRVFMGGCLEGLNPKQEFEAIRLDRHGDPWGNIYHKDESHTIQVENLWILQRESNLMPRVYRNQKYVLVVLWYDKESGAWAKHTYYGVTAGGQDLAENEDTYYQNLVFTAFFMVPLQGAGDIPDLTPTKMGTLRYVAGSEVIDLYSYDFGTNSFIALNPAALAGRAEIFANDSVWELRIQGVTALRADKSQGLILVNELTAIGGSFTEDQSEPRVEFWIGPKRIASVSKSGELAAPDMEERDANPALAEDFEIVVDGTWIGSLAAGKAYALEFSEFLV